MPYNLGSIRSPYHVTTRADLLQPSLSFYHSRDRRGRSLSYRSLAKGLIDNGVKVSTCEGNSVRGSPRQFKMGNIYRSRPLARHPPVTLILTNHITS